MVHFLFRTHCVIRIVHIFSILSPISSIYKMDMIIIFLMKCKVTVKNKWLKIIYKILIQEKSDIKYIKCNRNKFISSKISHREDWQKLDDLTQLWSDLINLIIYNDHKHLSFVHKTGLQSSTRGDRGQKIWLVGYINSGK